MKAFLLFGMISFIMISQTLADINIYGTGGGYQIQDGAGNILGTSSSQAGAQKVANVYTKQGQQVNWKSGLPETIKQPVAGPSATAKTGNAAPQSAWGRWNCSGTR